MTGSYNTGHDMWDDHKNQYGIITARIMCLRYLDMQANRKDPEERQFCAELREAMTMERNFADKPLYRKSWEDAQRDGEVELFRDSDLTNGWCAGEIDEAIRACEYGDGSHKLEPAVQAMLEHCGEERLAFILAVEVRRYRDEFSDENRAWSTVSIYKAASPEVTYGRVALCWTSSSLACGKPLTGSAKRRFPYIQTVRNIGVTLCKSASAWMPHSLLAAKISTRKQEANVP